MKLSDLGDLTPMAKEMAKEIEKVMERYVGEGPGVIIAFTCSPDWKTAHWVTNFAPGDEIRMVRELLQEMEAKVN